MDQSARLIMLELRLAELERKLNFVMRHLGVTYHEPQLPAGLSEAAALLGQGKKLEAVQVYRQITGCSLREAKQSVDALETKLGGS